MRRLSRTVTLLGMVLGTTATVCAATPAAAIVGPSADAPALVSSTVMVLLRAGTLAGFCSGIVVAPDVVLTAAHCVPTGASLKVHYREEGRPVLRDVAAVERHPEFHADAVRRRERSIDLALIRLAQPLPAPFRAATLGDRIHAQEGEPFRLAGFGLGRESDPASSGQLRVAAAVARAPLSAVLLWSRDPQEHGAGACTGDSGGPVLDAGADTVVGVIAWSAGESARQCGSLTQAVWIGPQRAWIDTILARWEAGH